MGAGRVLLHILEGRKEQRRESSDISGSCMRCQWTKNSKVVPERCRLVGWWWWTGGGGSAVVRESHDPREAIWECQARQDCPDWEIEDTIQILYRDTELFYRVLKHTPADSTITISIYHFLQATLFTDPSPNL